MELNYPGYIRMFINAEKKQAAIQLFKGNLKNTVKFSQEEGKQNYSMIIKMPTLNTEIRKLVDLSEGVHLSFQGDLFPNDGAIIFDLSKGDVCSK